MPKFISVVSSVIASVGYEYGDLYIRFRAGGIHVYYEVPESVHRDFMSAESHGQYFEDKIKEVYRCDKLT